MIIEQNDVELLSIRMRSKQDIDKDIDECAKVNEGVSQYSPLKRFSLNSINGQSLKDDQADDEHYEPTLRLLTLEKSTNGICGFHLTRTKWDPYPWISAVDRFTPAEKCGIKAGECVLEVNGCDVLGLRITEIANMVKYSANQVTLLLWSSNCRGGCEEEGLCASPMPRSMQRLSTIVQSVLTVIECPVCMDTITPPAMQCQNGHLLCVNCRILAENCPVCRDRYYPRPALIAEQLQAAITSAFNLCRSEDKVRQKIFGRHNRQQQMVKSSLECFTRARQVHKSSSEQETTITLPDDTEQQYKKEQTMTVTTNNRCPECMRRHVTAEARVGKRNKSTKACNKLLKKLLNFTSTNSMENRTNISSNALATNNSNTMTIETTPPEEMPRTVYSMEATEIDTDVHKNQQQRKVAGVLNKGNQINITTTNQLNGNFNPTNVIRPKQLLSTTEETVVAAAAIATASATVPKTTTNKTSTTKPVVNSDLYINSNPHCRTQMSSNRIEHFSLTSSDLTNNNEASAATAEKTQIMSSTNVHCVLESQAMPLWSLSTATSASPSLVLLNSRPCSNFNVNDLTPSIPRALKLSTNILEKAQNFEQTLKSVNLSTNGSFDEANFAEMSDCSTPSTVSLKSAISLNSVV